METAPKWLRPVAFVALLWNLLGCLAFAGDLRMTPEDVARLDAAQRALHDSRPAWGVAGTALAVGAGVIGSLGLGLLRRWAPWVLGLSLVGVLLQDAGLLRAGVHPGGVAVAMQSFVLLVAAALVALATRARRRGWLRRGT